MTVRSLSPLILLALAAPLSAAVPGSWRSLGPDGGSVYDLVYAPSEPQVMYAAVDGGVYRRSTVGGAWVSAGAGLKERGPVFSLAVSPGDPMTVYAGQDGVYKSLDGGGSWTRKLGVPAAYKVVTPVQGSRTVYAATPQGIYKSTNGGGAWSLLSRGLPARYRSTQLIADPVDPNRLYASAEDLKSLETRLYKTIDGGFSWKPVGRGLPPRDEISALAIDPGFPKILYAASFGQIFKSRDAGESWRPAGDRMLGGVDSLRVDPSRSNVVFAGINFGLVRSEDGGTTWTNASQGLPEGGAVYALAFPRGNPRALFAGVFIAGPERGGVFTSLNGGNSWTLRSKGISRLSVTSIAVAPDTLWVVADALLFKSADRGQSWQRVPVDPTARFADLVAVDPADPANVYVAFQDSFWRSRDGGQSWETAANLGVIAPTRLLVDPRVPSTLYVAGGGIAKSTDGGTTWTRLPNDGFFYDLVISPASPSTLYATVGDPRQVQRSTDGGTTWTSIQPGLPEAFSEPLAAAPQALETLYAAAAGSVYRTTDGGAAWSPVGDAFPNRSLQTLLFPAAPAALYVGVGFDTVYRLGGGDSWEPLGQIPVQTNFNLLAADPRDSCRIYAATQDRGLLAFTESGTAECR